MRKGAAVGPSMTLGEVAKALGAGLASCAAAARPGLAADGWFYTDHMNYPYGVHIAVVAGRSRDRRRRRSSAISSPTMSAARSIRCWSKARSPAAFAQGLGGALLEEFLYDERGEPLSVNFADYLMPTAREVPALDVLITEDAPSPLNPLGLKGAGEGGINAVGAAIAAAIDDAIGMPGAITQLPVTPQRLRAILQRAPSK